MTNNKLPEATSPKRSVYSSENTHTSEMKLRRELFAGARAGIRTIFDIGQWMIVVQVISFAGWKCNVSWLQSISIILRMMIMMYIFILLTELPIWITGNTIRINSTVLLVVGAAISMSFGFWIGPSLDGFMHILAQSMGVP